MSGEFGRYRGYQGYINEVIQQVADDCKGISGVADKPVNNSTVAFGQWLGAYVAIMARHIAFNEEGDSCPHESDLKAIDEAIAGLRAYREAYAADCERFSGPKIKYMAIRPDHLPDSPALIVKFGSDQRSIWEQLEGADDWNALEIVPVEMTEYEFKRLPLHEGF